MKLTLALPKGRTLRPVADLFGRAGMTGEPSLSEAMLGESRALVRKARFGEHEIDMLLLKPDDVPTYVEHGTADLGICGRDVLGERDLDLYQPVDLGLGRCRLVVAGRKGAPPTTNGRMPRVATKYPRAAGDHFAKRGVQVEIVDLQGSVELAPLTGLSDLIVDIVETGTTLAQNGLEVREEISTVSTVLIANRASYKLREAVVGPLVSAIRSACVG